MTHLPSIGSLHGASRPTTIGVVLAGLHDWSATDVEAYVPRPLAPVVNVPLVMHILQWFARGGVQTVVVCTNQSGYAFRRLLGDGSNLDLDLLYHEDRTPRGPAGCARDACTLHPAARYVITEANTIPCLDLRELLAAHEADGAAGTVVVGRDEGVPTGDDDRPTGIYVFRRDALMMASARGFDDLKEGLIPKLYRENMRVSRYLADRAAPRVHDTASYLELNRWALNEMVTGTRWCIDCTRVGDALVDASARVARSARLIGRCLIARDACVDDDAVIIGPTVVGRACRIGSGSVVRNCVIWDRATVAPGAVLDGRAVSRTGAVCVA